MDCCECKKKIRNEEEKKQLENRINKLVGQMSGIKKMVEDDAYCPDILIQLSAVYSSVKSLSSLILKNHMNTCVVEAIKKGDMSVVDEVTDLFMKFK